MERATNTGDAKRHHQRRQSDETEMIQITCFNCGWLIATSNIIKVDVSTVDGTCSRCNAVYRVNVSQLKQGEPFDDLSYWYTYDGQGNRILLTREQLDALRVKHK
jgi:transcription elongation factor Elf1